MFELFRPYNESQWNPETMLHAIEFHCMDDLLIHSINVFKCAHSYYFIPSICYIMHIIY